MKNLKDDVSIFHVYEEVHLNNSRLTTGRVEYSKRLSGPDGESRVQGTIRVNQFEAERLLRTLEEPAKRLDIYLYNLDQYRTRMSFEEIEFTETGGSFADEKGIRHAYVMFNAKDVSLNEAPFSRKVKGFIWGLRCVKKLARELRVPR